MYRLRRKFQLNFEFTCLAKDDSKVRLSRVSFKHVFRLDFFVILKCDSKFDHSDRRINPISDKFIKYDIIRISSESGAKSKNNYPRDGASEQFTYFLT